MTCQVCWLPAHSRGTVSMENTELPLLGEQISRDRSTRWSRWTNCITAQGLSGHREQLWAVFRSPSLSARAHLRNWAWYNEKMPSQKPCSEHMCNSSHARSSIKYVLVLRVTDAPIVYRGDVGLVGERQAVHLALSVAPKSVLQMSPPCPRHDGGGTKTTDSMVPSSETLQPTQGRENTHREK